MEPPFTQSLWKAAAPIYAAILEHPFLQGLTDGSLPENAFRHYAVQDALYLRDFGRGLALIGARSDADRDFLLFTQHGIGAVGEMEKLHQKFFGEWGYTLEQLYATPKAPNCLLYTSTLLRVAHERPHFEAVAAFLPCYWIYWEVGKHLAEKGSSHPLYQQWIDTYAGDEFGGLVSEVLAITDRLAADLTGAQKSAMTDRFLEAARCEWLFWDMGWTEQQWPV
jgi:thiaminase/transcriptional activator TenA